MKPKPGTSPSSISSKSSVLLSVALSVLSSGEAFGFSVQAPTHSAVSSSNPSAPKYPSLHVQTGAPDEFGGQDTISLKLDKS